MKKCLVLFGCIWCMLMSCSHEPTEKEIPGNNVHEWQDSVINGDATMSRMMFSVGDVMTVERQETTRATTEIGGTCTFSTGDYVAVGVNRGSAAEEIKLYRVKNDGSLEYAGGDNDPFVWKSTSETVTIRAWSYGTNTNLSFTLTAPETFDYSLEADQQTNGYHELLYCKAVNKSYSSGAIALTFYHQLTRLVFNVNHEDDSDLSVSSVSVGNSSTFPITARFAVPTGSSNVGTWTTGTTYGTITPKTETTQSGYECTYSAVVFPKTYAKDSRIFTLTNSDGDYSYNISETAGHTLAIGNQYNYTITLIDGVFRKNPLWYVAPYNMINATTMATTENAGYFFLWSDAMSKFAAQSSSYNDYRCVGKTITGQSGTWHMPILDEARSIFPGYDPRNAGTGSVVNPFSFDDGTGTYMASNLIVKFGYNAATRAGVNEASYWKKISNTELHAIRFLGTSYCSAWKYIFASNKMTVYSTIIGKVENSQSAAATFYTNNFSTITWGDNGTTAARRTFYLRGFYPGASSTPNTTQEAYGYQTIAQFWLATGDVSYNGQEYKYVMAVYPTKPNFCTEPGSITYGRNIRLFRDYK